ncbi:DUF4224 domain-containing protein [Massilia sp. CCM 8734]|uniref:DUF4224 domain-containing protein n=1 Tax=Massilia sp. CCM 8734 TaxID=2609283 RepID=UPI001424A52B|nr:DUF4224 domain-containing protein [Massilia sp. CCM 8734]NIA00078.1 DUF4224 domain-containing protein [Massilia sp. CCM 8734]
MANMFLTEDEVVELTGRTQRAAQKRVLNFMGIVSRERPDASLAILRLHVEESFGGGEHPKKDAPTRAADKLGGREFHT